MIKVKNLSKSFGSKQVLKGINLHCQPGKVCGIVGPNGAGKTTLFRCIAGLESYDGEVLSDFGKIKDHLGYLPTNPTFMSKITGWEYLKLLSLAKGIVEDNFDEKNIFDLPLGEYVEHYSTGMQKKLSLLAILLQSNDLFIFDEPYNGVDIQSSMLITDIINKLKERGKTILISSHIFATLRESCDEIHLLNEGIISTSSGPSNFADIEEGMKKLGSLGNLDKLNL